MAIRLIHLSDIHFGDEDEPMIRAAEAFVRASRFDLLVVSGDLTRRGERAEFASAASWIGALPGPVLVTPGNHDTPTFAVAERLLFPFRRYRDAMGPSQNRAFATPSLAAQAFNSARGCQPRLNWSKGAVSRSQVETVVRGLNTTQVGALRVVVCHHPLMEIPGAPMTGRVWGGGFAARRLAEAGVDLILTGHLHVPFVAALPFGDRQTFAIGAGTLSLRLRGKPASFGVIEIEGDHMTVDTVAWTGTELRRETLGSETLRPRSG